MHTLQTDYPFHVYVFLFSYIHVVVYYVRETYLQNMKKKKLDT